MDWSVPMKSKLRHFQQRLWDNKFDMFGILETHVELNDLKVSLEEIKRCFTDSSSYIKDGFDAVMDYVISSEIAAKSRSNNISYE
jgi:hypothetical protein